MNVIINVQNGDSVEVSSVGGGKIEREMIEEKGVSNEISNRIITLPSFRVLVCFTF